MQSTDKPLPAWTALTQPYWDAAKRGTLVAQYCRPCARYQFYPKPLCTACWGSELEWRPLSGRGKVYSYSIVRRAPSPAFGVGPYVVALVDLDEGIRILTNIVGVQPESVAIGQAVAATFEARGDTAVPVFAPL